MRLIQWRGQKSAWGLKVASLPLPFLSSLPLPFPFPLPLEVGPLNPARGSGGAL